MLGAGIDRHLQDLAKLHGITVRKPANFSYARSKTML
jgi:hypothetical protein